MLYALRIYLEVTYILSLVTQYLGLLTSLRIENIPYIGAGIDSSQTLSGLHL